MALIAGIDPGSSGAIAVYDTDTQRVISCDDIPAWTMTIGKKKRRRLDNIGCMELFDTYMLMGVEMCIIEAVGGRTGQSASAGFVFGYGVGALIQMMMERKMIIETTPPGTWKAMMKIPGKQKATDDDIMLRVAQVFPHNMDMFKGPKGGHRIDRAEAALLAKFGADFAWRLAPTGEDVDYIMAFRKADFGVDA